MINSATNNTVKYCRLKGSETRQPPEYCFSVHQPEHQETTDNIIDNNDITNAAMPTDL